jgi:hypothetical protein
MNNRVFISPEAISKDENYNRNGGMINSEIQ